MGFWSGFSRMVQGKPVFEAPEKRVVSATPVTAKAASVSASRAKEVPEVLVERCESRLNGDEMETTVWVTNKAAVEVELDKIFILGVTIQLDLFLLPGKAHQLRLYKGQAPTDDSHHKANLFYKQVKTGDYFCADFTIEYDYDSRGFYKVEDLHPIHPVRDI